MEKQNIIKKNKIFGGYSFLILSITEIIFFTSLLATPFDINGDTKVLFLFLFDLNIVELSTTILWIFILTIDICFFILGLYIIRFYSEKKEERELLKHIFFIGILILLITIIKIIILYQIQISIFNDTIIKIVFIELIQDMLYAPAYTFILWIIFIIPSCYEIIYSLAISGVGLNKYLTYKEKK